MRKLSVVLILIGFIVLGTSIFQIGKTKISQKKNLKEVQAMLETGEKSIDDVFPDDFLPNTGDKVGILHIPKLESDLPIIEGTHEDELREGVGHYKGTAYPLQDDQIVLSGHRDTVFRRMGELELGDIMTVQLPYGEFSYEIVETKIVDADDRTIIVPTSPDEVLTVTTCYPFNFVGYAPDRYIITALPVETKS